ncbi:polysaccharide pyruvyl transferase family protein [Salinicoccus roseus]|uniref:Polysaccharide pyruvyl transferase family protein n=1 Tax=Salinicoccus roseus TaxID=45670 RepID=A0ABT4YF85_9STAP|nr:polysaccharide pyruvyl transferase family protein [Salinicoccus roseus]MDB0579485.1 polysaccharide pyruvyl transferase family protein [Salinicoccus roseus]
MKIFFKGYYGFKNIGDDIFVHIANWYFKNKMENAELIFIGNELPKGIEYKKSSNKFHKNILEALYFMKADLIVYWGGSTFENISGLTDPKFYIMNFKLLSNKFLAFGISLGPFENEKDFLQIKKLTEKSSYIGVRDYKSLNFNKKANFTFDLAVLTPEVFPTPFQNPRNKWNIGVNFCQAKNIDEYYNYVKSFCIRESHEIQCVKIFVFNEKAIIDNQLSKKLYYELQSQGIKVNLIPYNLDTKVFLDHFTSIDFLFGTRLHSGIIAYAYNIKFVLNEYHEKCNAFVETINNPIREKDLVDTFSINYIKNVDYSSLISPNELKNVTLEELNNLQFLIEK